MQLEQYVPYEYLIVAAVVLAALFVFTLAFRMLAGRSSASESSRLSISEYLEVDKQRRLVLVRRDDVEHLVLIGGGQDVVVEAEIRPGVQRRHDVPAAPRVVPGQSLEGKREPTAAVARPEAAVNPVPLRAARPPVFAAEAPDQDRPEPRLAPLKADEKGREA